MMETWLHWDTSLMHWINSGWSSPVLDWLMPILRNKYTWIPLYIFCLGWVFFNLQLRQVGWTLLFIALSIFASDTISSKLIKNQVQRPRPCQVEGMNPPVIERIPCGSGYSFTSSHATNHFCIATFLITVFGSIMKRWKYLWWLWALSISLAQVYVGVHYPTDILAGGIVGMILGFSMGTLCRHRIYPQAIPVNKA